MSCNLVTSIRKKISSHTEINMELGNFSITRSEVYLKGGGGSVLFSTKQTAFMECITGIL